MISLDVLASYPIKLLSQEPGYEARLSLTGSALSDIPKRREVLVNAEEG